MEALRPGAERILRTLVGYGSTAKLTRLVASDLERSHEIGAAKLKGVAAAWLTQRVDPDLNRALTSWLASGDTAFVERAVQRWRELLELRGDMELTDGEINAIASCPPQISRRTFLARNVTRSGRSIATSAAPLARACRTARTDHARHERTSCTAPAHRRRPQRTRRASHWPNRPRIPVCHGSLPSIAGAPKRPDQEVPLRVLIDGPPTGLRPVAACGTSPRREEQISQWPCTGQAPKALARRGSRHTEDDQ